MVAVGLEMGQPPGRERERDRERESTAEKKTQPNKRKKQGGKRGENNTNVS